MKNKILIVNSNYYKDVSDQLLLGAENTLKENNFYYDVLEVPGTFEISIAIKKKIEENKYLGFIALGCVIKGSTYHFELISNECARSINSLSLQYTIPISFGVIACFNKEQALERASINKKNKGKEAALACIEMIKIFKS